MDDEFREHDHKPPRRADYGRPKPHAGPRMLVVTDKGIRALARGPFEVEEMVFTNAQGRWHLFRPK